MGAPKNTTQTTKVELSPEQRELLNLAMPSLREFAANPPEQYPGSKIAGWDPLQLLGQEQVLGITGQQGMIGQDAASANRFLMGDVLSPDSNPYLRQYIDAAVRPITEQTTQQILPNIRNEFVGAGQFGGSRQGIAEGLAAQGMQRQIGDTTANIATQAYGQGLEAMQRGLALAPQTQQVLAQPGITTSGVGDLRRQMSQALLNQDVEQFMYPQLLPLMMGKELASLVGGIPGGGSTTTASGGGSSPLMSGLGGAATGASLGSLIMPGVGTGVGAGLGALLGLFS